MFGWRHDDVRGARANASDEFALERLAGHDRACQSALTFVETKVRLACRFVWAVAFETEFGKDRANLALKVDRVFHVRHARKRKYKSECQGNSNELIHICSRKKEEIGAMRVMGLW